jgi:hypothetical protein
MKKWIWIVIAVILISFILILIGSNKNKSENPPVQLENSRGFFMGFVPIPKQPITTDAWLETFELLKTNADFVLHHSAIDWEDFVDSSNIERSAAATPNLESTNFIALMSRQKNLKLLIVIDPLTSNREEIDTKLPADVGTNFGDEKVRKAFKNYVVRIAKDYKPEYLGLGSEINTYMNKHPEDANNLLSLIDETIPLIKQESPNTKITSTFQYESLIGKTGNTQWSTFEKVEPKIDLVSITTYPSVYFSSAFEIPADYYNNIKEHTTKSIIIAESGWPTGGESKFHGSEKNQKEFVARFPELIKDVDVKLWIWWFFHDQPGEGYADFFRTMGLLTSDGKEKPSWNTWQEIHSLPQE